MDGHEPYREAVRHVWSSRPSYRNLDWENGSADGIADAVESALNLINREPMTAAGDWIDEEIRNLWWKQHPDGIVEGWHGDGNFTRTTLMCAFWKTLGVTVDPWRADLQVGAAQEGDKLPLSLIAGADWRGRVRFDRPRYREYLRLPVDYPRINQFPEWFVADRERWHAVRDRVNGANARHRGELLWDGIDVRLTSRNMTALTVTPD